MSDSYGWILSFQGTNMQRMDRYWEVHRAIADRGQVRRSNVGAAKTDGRNDKVGGKGLWPIDCMYHDCEVDRG